MPQAPSSHVLLMPNLNHLTHDISNLVSLITKTKLRLSAPTPTPLPPDARRPRGERNERGWQAYWVASAWLFADVLLGEGSEMGWGGCTRWFES
jgi:hypothetical protein